jgi:hypothetical protein
MSGLRGIIYTVFSFILLSALWVTSLTFLSARPAATDLLTEVGASVLNPFLAGRDLGVTETGYATLQSAAKAHPDQPLSLSVLKVVVPGREIIGRSYQDGVRAIYTHVAATYYDSGPDAVFNVPTELKQVLPNFALFNPDNIPILPGGPTVVELPPFLQPLFIFTGLTPTTFTVSGHQRLLDLLPWFWVAAAVLGALTFLLNRNEKKIAGLASSVIHATWPVVVVLVGLLIAANFFFKQQIGPYSGVLSVVGRAFLPTYGIALAIGLAVYFFTAILPRLQARGAQPAVAGASGISAAQAAAPSGERMRTPMGTPLSPEAPTYPEMRPAATSPAPPSAAPTFEPPAGTFVEEPPQS